MSNVKFKNLGRVKIIFGVIVVLTIFLMYIEYSNFNIVNKNLIRSDFWVTYFTIIAATMLPFYLFSKEANEREQSDNEKSENEKHALFISGISTIRPKLQVSFLDEKYADNKENEDILILKNIGIGNASSINIYIQKMKKNSRNEYQNILIQGKNYSNSEITIIPGDHENIQNFVLEIEGEKYVSEPIKSFDNIIVIYTNILGSEIYISEFTRKDKGVIDVFYHSTYNFLEPKTIEKDALQEIVKKYATDHSIEHSVYKYQEYMTSLSCKGVS